MLVQEKNKNHEAEENIGISKRGGARSHARDHLLAQGLQFTSKETEAQGSTHDVAGAPKRGEKKGHRLQVSAVQRTMPLLSPGQPSVWFLYNLQILLWLPALTIHFHVFPGKEEPIKVMLA